MTKKRELPPLIDKKVCSKCFKLKPTFEFYRDIRRSDGYFPWCKECTRAYRRKTAQLSPKEFTNDLLILQLSPNYSQPKTSCFNSRTRRMADIAASEGKSVWVMSYRLNKVWKWRNWKAPAYQSITEFLAHEKREA